MALVVKLNDYLMKLNQAGEQARAQMTLEKICGEKCRGYGRKSRMEKIAD
jgi:hypothetical protein